MSVSKRLSSVFICLVLILGLSACASHSRSSKTPIAGKIHEFVDRNSRTNPTWTLAERKSTDHYYLFGFVNNYKANIKHQQKYKRRYFKGADTHVCYPIVSATLGIYLPIDFLIWVVQLGGNNSACFAQIIDYSPEEVWGSEYKSGKTYTYSEPLEKRVKFYYKDRYIESENLGDGVFAIEKTKLPKPMSQLKLKLKSGFKVEFSDK